MTLILNWIEVAIENKNENELQQLIKSIKASIINLCADNKGLAFNDKNSKLILQGILMSAVLEAENALSRIPNEPELDLKQ
jgi:hypothetical protein